MQQLDSLNRPIFHKLIDVERRLSRTRGPFWLFAIGKREETLDKWDLIVSAAWLFEDKLRSLTYVTSELESAFAPDELIQISRIATLRPDNDIVQNLTAAFSQEGTLNLVQNTVVNGMEFSEVVVITARRPDVATTAM